MRNRGRMWLLVCGMAGLLPVATARAEETVPVGEPVAPLAPPKETLGDPGWTAAKLHSMNQMEIEIGKLEQRNGQMPRVKEFAARIVQDHQAAERQVMAFAKKHKIDVTALPASLPQAEDKTTPHDPDDIAMQAEMKRLESLKGGELDRAFLTAMISGHDKAIDLASSARAATSDRDLATLLDQLTPSLQKHRRMAATLNNAINGTSSAQ